jgi:hypothetical protein
VQLPNPIYFVIKYLSKSLQTTYEAPRDQLDEEQIKTERLKAFLREKERLKASTEAFTSQR